MREVIDKHGLQAKKSLGQNFLLNMDVTRRIAKAAGPYDKCTVIEIGPGPGGLTRALLEAGAQVIAIERDSRCVDILKNIQSFFPGQLQVIEGDALKITPQSLAPQGSLKIVANLPYNIATALLVNWVNDLGRISSLTLMFQKEVVLRMLARPRTKEYGRLSILTQWLFTVERLFDLSPRAFTPAPKVTSTVVQLTPQKICENEKKIIPILALVTQHAFGQRRKMIRTSLKPLFSEQKLIKAGLNPCSRAEELFIKDFIRLALNYAYPALTE